MNENDDIESVQRIIEERSIKQKTEQFMKDLKIHPFLPILKRIERLRDLTNLCAIKPTRPNAMAIDREVSSLKINVKTVMIYFEQEKEERKPKPKEEPIFPNAKLVEDAND